jgi:hypothetical protein
MCARRSLAAAAAAAPPPPCLQLDHIGSACQDRVEQQEMQTLLVLDLHHPAAAAAATVVSASARDGGPSAPAPLLLPPAAPAAPLGEPVVHVAYGGGPHLLLAACTRDTLAVVSLEGLAAHLFQQQTSGGEGSAHGGGDGGSEGACAGQQALWHQLAAAHCGHAEVLAIRWEKRAWALAAVCSLLSAVPRLRLVLPLPAWLCLFGCVWLFC